MPRCESRSTDLWCTIPDERSHRNKRIEITAVASTWARLEDCSHEQFSPLFLLCFAQDRNAAGRRLLLSVEAFTSLHFAPHTSRGCDHSQASLHIRISGMEGVEWRMEGRGIAGFSRLQSGRCAFIFFLCYLWKIPRVKKTQPAPVSRHSFPVSHKLAVFQWALCTTLLLLIPGFVFLFFFGRRKKKINVLGVKSVCLGFYFSTPDLFILLVESLRTLLHWQPAPRARCHILDHDSSCFNIRTKDPFSLNNVPNSDSSTAHSD